MFLNFYRKNLLFHTISIILNIAVFYCAKLLAKIAVKSRYIVGFIIVVYWYFVYICRYRLP